MEVLKIPPRQFPDMIVIIDLLSKLDSNSILGAIIKHTLNQPALIPTLIAELKHDCTTTPQETKDFLGERIFDLLVNYNL